MKNRRGCNIYETGDGEGCANKDLSIYDGDKRAKSETSQQKKRSVRWYVSVCIGTERQAAAVVVWGMG